MSDDNDIFDALGEASEEPDFGGGDDYADWWDPTDAGETLVGIIVELHSEPQDWTDPGEVPNTVRTVMSVGNGDYEAGDVLTPKQHKQLMNGLEDANIGDLVRLKFTGYEKVQGNMMHTYEVGVLPEDQWGEMDGADKIQSLYDAYDGLSGDNRRTEPYEDESPSSSDDSSSSGDSEPETELGEAASFLRDFVGMQNGSTSIEQATKMLTDVRDYDVEAEEVAAFAGLEVDGDEIKEQ